MGPSGLSGRRRGINYCIRLFRDSYTWKIYVNKVLNLGSIYSFWKELYGDEKIAKQRYIQMFYNLQFRNLVKTVPIPAVEAPRPPAPKATATVKVQPGRPLSINSKRRESRFQRVSSFLKAPRRISSFSLLDRWSSVLGLAKSLQPTMETLTGNSHGFVISNAFSKGFIC